MRFLVLQLTTNKIFDALYENELSLLTGANVVEDKKRSAQAVSALDR